MAAGRDYVGLSTHTDPVEAELLTDLLQQNGVAARLLGTRCGPLIGVGQNILELRIEVPADQVALAREILELAPVPEEATLGEAAPGDGPREAPSQESAGASAGAPQEAGCEELAPARRKRVIVGAGLMVPGGAQYHVGRYWGGAGVSVVVALGLAFFVWLGDLRGLLLVGSLLAFDILTGLLARPSGAGGQLLGVALAVALSLVMIALLPADAWTF